MDTLFVLSCIVGAEVADPPLARPWAIKFAPKAALAKVSKVEKMVGVFINNYFSICLLNKKSCLTSQNFFLLQPNHK